ncbi:fimbrial isopeptide formation D2 domain-containing protein [Clostridium collagenovorans DSM 3089]|uniref:Fimbrial isopeptide formation D2 domain-containing protein n=1 Tax=Clostridium collagenovorans DSM 3089 TaxID=1121306 RepID=A0A1M5WT03_9CLOT|nr:SpaH/EbpB family LPXTG-anchored major pilin [Clostridium collagenovorans]SHH90785.1 fimbrial isopeptide formation D2 domain-containing protein [Clostridium collagenovorans DSM 3089]
MGKKSLKKISVFLSTVMLMVSMMSIMAFATPPIAPDAPTKGSLTITKDGAEFKAYKVLNANQNASAQCYDYSVTPEFSDFFGNVDYGNYTVDGIKNLTADQMKVFGENLHKFVIEKSLVANMIISSSVKTEVDFGYYLVLESSGTSGGSVVVSTPMITSVPAVSGDAWQYDVTLYPKDNDQILSKKIVEGSNRVDTSSANIGDTIKYEVKSLVPRYSSNLTKVKYKFTDTMSKGLTYDEATGITIKIGSEILQGALDGDPDAANKHYVVKKTMNADETTTIEITFNYEKIKAYSLAEIILSYQARLNEKALIKTNANVGNVNNVKLEYTNNPNVEGSVKELNSKVTTYTWGLGLKKVDANNITKDLEGAEFKITDSADINTGNVLGKYTYNAAGEVVILSGNLTTNGKGEVAVTGLKDGDYFIHEVKAPAGYSLLKAPVKVTITATKDAGNNYTGAATIAVTNGNEAGSIVSPVTMKDNNVLFNVQIKNYSGISLPTTGGIGTDGFVKIAISLLAIVAVSGVVYLAIEKKKRA